MSRRIIKRLAMIFGSLVLLSAMIVTLMLVRQEREYLAKRHALFAQPFSPDLIVERGKLPGNYPASFEVQFRFTSGGGPGQSLWLVRGRLLDNSGRTVREIWNSEEQLAPELVTRVMMLGGTEVACATVGKGPAAHLESFSRELWGFNRENDRANHLTCVVEAVALPLPTPEDQKETQGISVSHATIQQLAEAKRQLGARYFQRTLALNAQDDSQFRF
jgi:hypothetical protein